MSMPGACVCEFLNIICYLSVTIIQHLGQAINNKKKHRIVGCKRFGCIRYFYLLDPFCRLTVPNVFFGHGLSTRHLCVAKST